MPRTRTSGDAETSGGNEKNSTVEAKSLLALVVTASLATAYTYVEYVQPRDPWYAGLSLAVAVAAVASLRGLGFSRQVLRLRYSGLSRGGALLLMTASLLMLPILGSSTGFVGWRWLAGLLFAPASGIAQEVFFRGSVLPVLEKVLPGRPLLALLGQTAVFVGWHVRTFTLLPSVPVAVLVGAVLALAGLAWGRQVQRDGTLLWSICQHSLFLMVMSMFDWA